MKKIHIKQLGKGFSIFGNKGNVWDDTAHAYKIGTGNLCGTPALSSNHAGYEKIEQCEIFKHPVILQLAEQCKGYNGLVSFDYHKFIRDYIQ